jgi:hypothetical protein
VSYNCTIYYIHYDDCNISLVSQRISYRNLQLTFPILVTSVTILANIATRTEGNLLQMIGTSPSHLKFFQCKTFHLKKRKCYIFPAEQNNTREQHQFGNYRSIGYSNFTCNKQLFEQLNFADWSFQSIFYNLRSSTKKRETIKFYDKAEWLLYAPPGLTFRNSHSTRSEFVCLNGIFIIVQSNTTYCWVITNKKVIISYITATSFGFSYRAIIRLNPKKVLYTKWQCFIGYETSY